jgi:hypothetical protein
VSSYLNAGYLNAGLERESCGEILACLYPMASPIGRRQNVARSPLNVVVLGDWKPVPQRVRSLICSR